MYGFRFNLFFIMIMASFLSGCAKRSAIHIHTAKDIKPPHSFVHFPFNNDEVLAEEVSYLDENAEWMKQNDDVVVILEGHCDETGPTDYNMELGDRRARTVKDLLVRGGIDFRRIIMVVSYGDLKPLDPAHNIDAYRKNRRVKFVIR